MELLAMGSVCLLADFSISGVLYIVLGLGLVIFFHELGHFAVAKWCDVHVERFSIGLGPILWSRKKGETEYALSAIPFGGYVKMLGQDDMDPSQLTNEEIAQDPRAYSAKPVYQRMAIISAGVIMNVLTAVLFFAVALGIGIRSSPPEIGHVQVGMPAWSAGLELGDTITRIDGKPVKEYFDIARRVALSTGEKITVEGFHADKRTFKRDIVPSGKGTRRMIGVPPIDGLQLAKVENDLPPFLQGSAAARAETAFQTGDVIRRVDGQEVSSYVELARILSEKRASAVTIEVARGASADENQRSQKQETQPVDEQLVAIKLEPEKFRSLGLRLDIGRIVAIKRGSPAEKEGLKVGDKIIGVDGKSVGNDVDPLRLPGMFAERRGQQVKITISREVEGGQPKTGEIVLVPEDRPGWTDYRDHPSGDETPLAIPAIGAAFHLIPQVLSVEPNGPCADLVKPGDFIKSMNLVLPEGEPTDGLSASGKPIEYVFKHEDKDQAKEKNFTSAFWTMQIARTRSVELTVERAGEDKTVTVTPKAVDDWYVPYRGMLLAPKAMIVKSSSPLAAVGDGVRSTLSTVGEIYLTLRNLFAGRLSFKELRGPVGIATIGYQFAKAGIPDLCMFLGMLSVNLAILNFLPIPVLDGGHMVFLTWEAVTRRKPSEKVVIAATYLGVAFLLLLMVTVLWLDLFYHRAS